MTATQTRRKRFSYGPEVCDWIEEHCVLPTGDTPGAPFVLMEWQRKWITELYRCDAKGNKQYRWSLLGVPKGNGKTPLLAALALYHLVGDPDEQDPWIVMAAASDKQADICFAAAKEMCRLSPTLSKYTQTYRWEIHAKGSRGKIERVAASKGRLDGKIVSMLIMDELHEWQEETWVVLTGGALKRQRTQIIQATTAGWDKESICYREYLKGRANLPTYQVTWYEAPETADYQDPGVWKATNPAWGTLVHEQTLREVITNQTESQFRRYRLNQWVESEDFWLPNGAWDACKVGKHELIDAPIYVGWDASTKHDSTAIVVVQWQGERLHVFSKVWARPLLPNGDADETWRLPIVECENYLRTLFRTYRVGGIAYDPAFISWSAGDLEAEGLPMIDWPQTPSRMCPATQALYESVVQGEIAHDGDEVLARHVRSVRARNMRNGAGQMLEKGTPRVQIDAAIALVMAVGQAVGAQTEPESIVMWVPKKPETIT